MKLFFLNPLIIIAYLQFQHMPFELLVNPKQGGIYASIIDVFYISKVQRLDQAKQVKDNDEILENADRFFEAGENSYQFGDWQEALLSWKEALTLYRQVKAQSSEVKTLYRIGDVYEQLKDYQKALDFYQESLRIVHELNNLEQEARILHKIGDVYYLLGDYSLARDFYRAQLSVVKMLQIPSQEAKTLYLIGNVNRKLEDYSGAFDYYQASLKIIRQFGNKAEEVKLLNNLGNISYLLEDFSLARDYYRDSLEVVGDLDLPTEKIKIINNIGNINYLLGNYLLASDYYLKGLKISREINNQFEEIRALNNIGNINYFLEDYSTARDYYTSSLLLVIQLGDKAQEASIRNNLGNTYVKLEKYLEAHEHLNVNLDLLCQIHHPLEKARALFHYGNVNLLLGNDVQAEENLEQSLKLIREEKKNLVSLNNIGIVGDLIGNDPVTQTYYEVRLVIARDRDNVIDEVSVLNSLGKVHQYRGEQSLAWKHYQQGLTIAQQNNDRTGEALTLKNVGYFVEKQGRPELAIVFFKQVVNLYEYIRSDSPHSDNELQQTYIATVEETYRHLAELLLQQNRIIEAQRVLELLKLEELRDFTRNAGGLEAETVLALHGLEQQIRDEFGTLVAFAHQLDECEKVRCAQLGTLNHQRRQQADLFDAQVLTFVTEIRDNRQTDDFFFDPRFLSETSRHIVAEPGTLLVYPFVLEEQLWLLYTAQGVAGAFPIDVNQLELGAAVVNFRRALASHRSKLKDLNTLGYQLYSWLLAPLSKEIQENDIHTLVFAQDRVTRYIPMGALWDGEQYLVEGFTLSTILSAELTDMSESWASLPEGKRVLGLGLSDAVRDLGPLPNVEIELDRVIREEDKGDTVGIFPGLVLLNEAFHFDALTENLFGHQVLHLATHGKFVPGVPEESFLMMGNAQELRIPRINSIGAELRNIHLVVLSACETAVGGPGADGVEVAGISSYFLAAKRASAVLASLWLVDDASTSVLMQTFYEHLSQESITKAEALRQAQLALLRGDGGDRPQRSNPKGTVDIQTRPDPWSEAPIDFSHPYYWAPFILIGNGL